MAIPPALRMIAAMEGMTFEGPKGTIYIRPEDHVAIQDMYILKLLNITDPDANFYEYVDDHPSRAALLAARDPERSLR